MALRALLAFVLLAASPALGREGSEQAALPARWGIGMLLGDPFGLSLKRYVGGPNAWDAYVAFAYGPGIRFGADWLWIVGRGEQGRKFDVDAYVGLGPFIGTFQGQCGPWLAGGCNGGAYFGGRVPLGAEILLREAPLSLGAEIAPGFGVAPAGTDPARAGLVLDFLFAVRYLF